MFRHLLALTATGLMAAAGVAHAHHSGSAYETGVSTSVKGVLKEVHFENPHVRLVLVVTDEQGKAVDWQLEGQPPGWYRRAGIRRADFEKGIGDKVTIQMHPGKENKPIGFFEKITFSNGTFVHFGT